jgi:hypothetical protein
MPESRAICFQNAKIFIATKLPRQDLARLHVNLMQAAAALSMAGASHDDALFDLTISAEDALYKTHLESGRETDIMTEAPITTRTSADLHAIKPLSERTVANRRNAFLKVYQHITKTNEAPKQPYAFIQDVDQWVAAVCAQWTSHSSWGLNAYAFANVVESLGLHDLSQEYKRRFRALEATRKKTKAVPKVPLTLDEQALIHKHAATLGEKALALVEDNPLLFDPDNADALMVLQHALVLLLIYGTSKEWSNQRRAAITYRFKTVVTDVSQDNYVECTADGGVTLTINSGTKVRKKAVINVTQDCPILAKLLLAIEGCPGRPEHLLHVSSYRQRKQYGNALTHGSAVNKRLTHSLHHVGIPPELVARACGCNAARHADVKVNRKRRALTDEERADDRAKAAKRLSSVAAAETMYDQN